MNSKNIALLLIVVFCGLNLRSSDNSVLELHSGWSWYPHYYYNRPYRYPYHHPYTAYGLSLLHHSGSGYRYPNESYWYDDYSYHGYAYPGYYSGFYFRNAPYVLNLSAGPHLPYENIPRLLPDEPGSAPLTTQEEQPSLQDLRLNRFLRNERATGKQKED